MTVGTLEYSNNSFSTRSQEFKTRSGSSSVIKDIAEEALNELGNHLRIDQTITGLFTSPLQTLINKIVPLGLMVASFALMGVTFGIYIIAMNCLFTGAIKIYLNKNQDLPSKLDRSYYPTSTLIKNLLIGALAFFPILGITHLVGTGIGLALNQFGLSSEINQNVGKMLGASGVTGIFIMIFGCVVAPIGEEFIFRGVGADAMIIKDKTNWIHKPTITEIRKSPEFKTWDKIKTVLKTSLIFGLMHLSPFQGWSNIIIFVVTAILGLLCGLLAELTGDLWAPTLVHMMNNILATFMLRAG